MKKCGVDNSLLADYIYGEIEDASKVKELEGHIKGCAECAKETDALRAVLKASKLSRVNFSEEVWSMQRQDILRKVRQSKPTPVSFMKAFFGLFSFKKLGLAVLIVVMAGVGTQYFRYVKSVEQQKAIAEKMELLQNLAIIERLDFYEKISGL